MNVSIKSELKVITARRICSDGLVSVRYCTVNSLVEVNDLAVVMVIGPVVALAGTMAITEWSTVLARW